MKIMVHHQGSCRHHNKNCQLRLSPARVMGKQCTVGTVFAVRVLFQSNCMIVAYSSHTFLIPV